jgi:hypothetical protein
MRGLIIKTPWIEKILSREKTWEIRGSNTKIRGKIALIKSGTQMIFGYATLVDSIKLSEKVFLTAQEKHAIPREICKKVTYKNKYAWILKNPKKLKKPIPYNHPQGAVIWVKLNKEEN